MATEFTDTEVNKLKKLLANLNTDNWSAPVLSGGLPRPPLRTALPTASKDYEGLLCAVPASTGVAGRYYYCRLAADGTTYEWVALDNASEMPSLTAVDFLVGTATGLLSGEIVAGTGPGGELGGTWASPTVDATHSGSAHIVLPAGELGGSNASPTVTATHSGSKHIHKLVASNSTDQSTISTSAADVIAFTGLSIPVTSGILIKGKARKSSGAAALASLGLKLNSTVTLEADNGPQSLWQSTAANQAEAGWFEWERMPVDANNTNAIRALWASTSGAVVLPAYYNGGPDGAVNATITSITIRGITASASQTLYVQEVAIYEVLYS